MLPDFPETRLEYEQIVNHRIAAKAKELSVIDQLVRSITQHEGGAHTYFQEENGEVTDGYRPVKVEIRIRADEVPSLVGEKLVEKLDEIAAEKAKQTSTMFYTKMDEVTEKTGNRFSTDSGSFTKEVALQMIERIGWSPDHVFLTHPAAAQQMKSAWEEWQQDPEFMRKFNDLQELKKEEWRARENRRKLVD